MSKPRIAFFGLGIMGGGMARRLLAAGYPVTVYNRNPEKSAAIEREGAKTASSPRDAARNADIMVSMVADDNASRAVWLGEQGAIADATRGAILIESSTLTVGWVHELANAAKKHGLELLDAPVTGSKTQAAAGELNFYVGGAAETLEKAKPVFMAMGRSVTHLGPSGSGAMIKLINNFACGVQAALLAEVMTLIERSGLDRTKSLEMLMGGAPGSPLFKLISGRMVERNYIPPNFLLPLMAKDLTYAQAEGKKLSIELGTAAAALEIFKRSIAQGDSDKDFSAIVEQFRRTAK